ncbi:LIP-domain-containing protein [Dissoconium aciculare CBS 342.82]|uniref:LIP-domain-containing protein n=1 Tax=Dissoconium aciculare CBS 342.82 TaxID=1314786 RepID=A0A6J3M9H8_9PEZI|nr:LIP-domain-containing protein [Dissoconium aciculare CBS 342.82]KAF1824508.1 LIP-domain-containing protein [Dissoconium aciculare CBS 342.82]
MWTSSSAAGLLALAAVVSAGAQVPSAGDVAPPTYSFSDSNTPLPYHHGGKWPLAVSTSNDNSTAGIPPSQDPWYSAPAGYEHAKPGQVLKIRNATALASTIANASEAYHILYRTTSGDYKAAWAVTTLLVPFANITTSRDKLLSYHIPYDSADVDASPSYTLYSGGGYGGDAAITEALGRGYIVSTPDYEGPGAFFTAGVFSGHATLDSVRAVRSKKSPVQLAEGHRYATWGYSGGALAGEWAAELQVQYAPELKFEGHALGGLTPNITSVLYTINGTVYAGLAPAGIVGILSQYPDTQAYLLANLNPSGPYNATRFLQTKNFTLLESIAQFVGQNIFLYFQNGEGTVQSRFAMNVVNRDGVMGYHGVPAPPLFVYKAIGDDVSPVHDTDILVERYCRVGATIDYQRNTVGTHQTESTNGDARAVAFLEKLFSGTYKAEGCTITNVTIG